MASTYGPDDTTPARSPRAMAATRIHVEPPASLPPTAVQIRGKGWSFNLPLVVVTALLSALGARLIPTATSSDINAERAAVTAERSELAAERFRQEIRQEIAAMRAQQAHDADTLSNRMVLLEERQKAAARP